MVSLKGEGVKSLRVLVLLMLTAGIASAYVGNGTSPVQVLPTTFEIYTNYLQNNNGDGDYTYGLRCTLSGELTAVKTADTCNGDPDLRTYNIYGDIVSRCGGKNYLMNVNGSTDAVIVPFMSYAAVYDSSEEQILGPLDVNSLKASVNCISPTTCIISKSNVLNYCFNPANYASATDDDRELKLYAASVKYSSFSGPTYYEHAIIGLDGFGSVENNTNAIFPFDPVAVDNVNDIYSFFQHNNLTDFWGDELTSTKDIVINITGEPADSNLETYAEIGVWKCNDNGLFVQKYNDYKNGLIDVQTFYSHVKSDCVNILYTIPKNFGTYVNANGDYSKSGVYIPCEIAYPLMVYRNLETYSEVVLASTLESGTSEETATIIFGWEDLGDVCFRAFDNYFKTPLENYTLDVSFDDINFVTHWYNILEGDEALNDYFCVSLSSTGDFTARFKKDGYYTVQKLINPFKTPFVDAYMDLTDIPTVNFTGYFLDLDTQAIIPNVKTSIVCSIYDSSNTLDIYYSLYEKTWGTSFAYTNSVRMYSFCDLCPEKDGYMGGCKVLDFTDENREINVSMAKSIIKPTDPEENDTLYRQITFQTYRIIGLDTPQESTVPVNSKVTVSSTECAFNRVYGPSGGTYRITGLDANCLYTYKVEASGFETVRGEVGDQALIMVRMFTVEEVDVYDPGVLLITVKHLNESFVPNAKVYLKNTGGSIILSGNTNGNGYVELQCRPNDILGVRAEYITSNQTFVKEEKSVKCPTKSLALTITLDTTSKNEVKSIMSQITFLVTFVLWPITTLALILFGFLLLKKMLMEFVK